MPANPAPVRVRTRCTHAHANQRSASESRLGPDRGRPVVIVNPRAQRPQATSTSHDALYYSFSCRLLSRFGSSHFAARRRRAEPSSAHTASTHNTQHSDRRQAAEATSPLARRGDWADARREAGRGRGARVQLQGAEVGAHNPIIHSAFNTPLSPKESHFNVQG
jgi:hypothetical protein